jgi:hypothetical protein
MLGDLITIVQGLTGAVTGAFNWKRQLDDKNREKFASLCDQIGDLLERASKTSEDRRESIGLCAQLREYVEPIRDVARSAAVEPDDINRLATALDGVCDAWQQLGNTAGPGSHSYEGYIDQFVAAKGHFRGLADVTRAR